jgi:uncharacterized RDD family membrane protein YckC
MSTKTAPPTPSLVGHYAGFTSRALAFIIDSAIIGISLITVSWILSVTVTMLQVRTILGFSLKAITGSAQFLDVLFGPTVVSAATLLYIAGYHLFFLLLIGQTPGKTLMGLKVVRLNGKRLDGWHALLRVLGYAVSALPLYLGFVWVFIDDRRQAWHDKLAGTCVVYTWEARPDERFLVAESKQLASAEEQKPEQETKN